MFNVHSLFLIYDQMISYYQLVIKKNETKNVTKSYEIRYNTQGKIE